jgi:hypothetical protein
MEKICPKPNVWHKIYGKLDAYSRSRVCVPKMPPVPLILAGWNFSNDVEKRERWNDMVEWASKNGCELLVSNISVDDFYTVETPTSYLVGPNGGPSKLSWNFETREKPEPKLLTQCVDKLKSSWPEIVGAELATMTKPIKFSGAKKRALVVRAEAGTTPSWGTWNTISRDETARSNFRRFRSAINTAIMPHHVDHVIFSVKSG